MMQYCQGLAPAPHVISRCRVNRYICLSPQPARCSASRLYHYVDRLDRWRAARFMCNPLPSPTTNGDCVTYFLSNARYSIVLKYISDYAYDWYSINLLSLSYFVRQTDTPSLSCV